PLLLEQAKAEAELARLERLERAHRRNKVHLEGSIRANESEVDRLSGMFDAIGAAIARRRDTRGDAFAMVIHDVRTAKRPDAEARLGAALGAVPVDRSRSDGWSTAIGSIGGFDLTATLRSAWSIEPELILTLDRVPESEVRLPAGRLADTALVTRLEHKL